MTDAAIHLQHGQKIESLCAISNFQQFRVYNTNNLRENPLPEKPRKRRIIIDSGSDFLQLEVSCRSTQLNTLFFAGKAALSRVRKPNSVIKFGAVVRFSCILLFSSPEPPFLLVNILRRVALETRMAWLRF